jgi:hypothetical protein
MSLTIPSGVLHGPAIGPAAVFLDGHHNVRAVYSLLPGLLRQPDGGHLRITENRKRNVRVVDAPLPHVQPVRVRNASGGHEHDVRLEAQLLAVAVVEHRTTTTWSAVMLVPESVRSDRGPVKRTYS